MKVESNVKQDQIVETALRRFSHFGIAKTTLTEVADDLSVSKQVLSYYFSDKQSLVNAVIEKLTIEYGQHLKTEMEGSRSVEEGLLKLTEVKGFFFEKYFMLVIQADHLELARKAAGHNWRQHLADTELALVTNLFENGVGTGELRPLDARKTGELLLETLYAFSRCVKDKGALPDADAFREVMTKQQEVIKLFYQGLKAEKWVN
ncbi:MAG TPA: TetR/AcrR family transcriptional regulator [Flavisolibacter sp.]|jgi:TetR/AcrR family transcriptional repressor of mexJK operon|nr:TetR/AcrR family transcriptional regulator [Flavisolibacter sp.]